MDGERLTEGGDSVLGLNRTERLLIWSLRHLVLRQGEPCALVAREFADACHDGADDALATFRVLIEVTARTARSRIRIGRPGWPELTGDERRLLALLGAAQTDDRPTFDALLSWFTRHEVRHELSLVVHAMAMTLAAHDLWLSFSPPPAAVASWPLGPVGASRSPSTNPRDLD